MQLCIPIPEQTLENTLFLYTKEKLLELLAHVGDQTHEESGTKAKLVAQLSDYSVEQVFSDFSVKEINTILKSYNLLTAGTKSTKLERLAKYFADKATRSTGTPKT